MNMCRHEEIIFQLILSIFSTCLTLICSSLYQKLLNLSPTKNQALSLLPVMPQNPIYQLINNQMH